MEVLLIDLNKFIDFFCILSLVLKYLYISFPTNCPETITTYNINNSTIKIYVEKYNTI